MFNFSTMRNKSGRVCDVNRARLRVFGFCDILGKRGKGDKGMKIFIEENYEAVSKRAAEIIKAHVCAKPATVLGLATGSTPVGMYEELIRMYKFGEIDFSQVTSFNLDEYFPIKKDNAQSYAFFMSEKLFKHINIKSSHIPDGEAEDYAAECIAYEEKIAAHGGVDLQVLGIGNNGHIGFNEPSDEFITDTHYAELDESTIKANARFFENENEVPRHSLTMGIRTIFSAKKIMLLASGAAKADAVFQTVKGPVTPKNPASILQLHADVTIIADKEAGKQI
jgi:glucosamine-6-phosphate deaminase